MAGKKREENGNHCVDFPTSVFVPATVLGRVDCIPADLEVAIALEVLKVECRGQGAQLGAESILFVWISL